MVESSVLEKLGVYTIDSLAATSSEARSFLVDQLLFSESVNLAAGDSGLGKTALLAQLGLAVASGTPWLGHDTRKGPVLFIDGESPAPEFVQMIRSLSQHLGLAAVPNDFFVYSPNWDRRLKPMDNILNDVTEQVKKLRPTLLLIDPLRGFWPEAEGKAEDAVKMIQKLREFARDYKTTSIVLHHLRKQSSTQREPVSLETDPHQWFERAAGARALVNQVDSRIGIDRSSNSEADIVVSGFVRMLGTISPIHIQRTFDDSGAPLGYRPLSGVDRLPAKLREALETLPAVFRYSEMHSALGGKSHTTTSTLLKQALAAQVLRAEGEGREKRYLRNAGETIATVLPFSKAA